MYVQTQITVSAPTGKQLRNLYQISSWGTKKIHSIESTVEMGEKKAFNQTEESHITKIHVFKLTQTGKFLQSCSQQ